MPPLPEGLPQVTALVSAGALLLQPLEFALPTYLLATGQPRKPSHLRRCAVAFLGILVYNLAISTFVWMAMGLPPEHPARYLTNTVSYALYLAVLVIAVRHVFEANVWSALFCATAGYTIQNLGSGTGEFVRILLEQAMGTQFGRLGTMLCSDVSIVVVITLYYLVYIRHARRIGRLGDDSRSMLGMLVLVIMVVIAFDVLIRGLERTGTQPGFLLALRVVHVAVCMFVLYAETEVLVNARLRGEVATREALSAERERQYETSRQTIAAVNRRVHDIRHQVLRDLSNGDSQVSREVLVAVAHDISVYDTQVATGNDVLDTILTERRLLCQRQGVTLSCIADGAALTGLCAADLYALVGSLLDHAIGVACSQPDQDRRSVSFTLRGVGTLALIHLEHYARDQVDFPVGASEIVERHGGTLSSCWEDGIATVDVMLPAAG